MVHLTLYLPLLKSRLWSVLCGGAAGGAAGGAIEVGAKLR